MSRPRHNVELSIVTFGPEAYRSGQQSRYAAALIGDHFYLIGSEGVGWDLNVTYAGEAGKREFLEDFGKNLDTVRAEAFAGDNGFVTIDELVRTFGSRLESNYFQWRVLLDNALKGE